jgi:hypothetical protein
MIFAFLELSAFLLYNIVANEVICGRIQAFAAFRFALLPLHFEKQVGTSSEGGLGSDHPALSGGCKQLYVCFCWPDAKDRPYAVDDAASLFPFGNAILIRVRHKMWVKISPSLFSPSPGGWPRDEVG